MNDITEKAVDFHGHLGPFLIIGVRMGLIALKNLDSKNHSISRVIAETGTKPPVSCIIDGIQITTGCTLGRGSIEVIDNHKPKAIFFNDGMSLEIELKKDVLERILEGFKVESSERIAERIMELNDKELFLIRSREIKNA